MSTKKQTKKTLKPRKGGSQVIEPENKTDLKETKLKGKNNVD